MNCSSRHRDATNTPFCSCPRSRVARYDRSKCAFAPQITLPPRSPRRAGRSSLAGCAKKHHRRRHPLRRASPLANPIDGETGLASWYGHPYHGRAAADGEIYDMEKLTAAHRTLPFGTWVRVINLGNGKTVDVRIIDRGPFVEGPHHRSLARRRRGDRHSSDPASRRFAWTFSRFPPRSGRKLVSRFKPERSSISDRAERLRASLEREFGPAHLVQRADTPALWRVLVGRVPSEQAAAALAQHGSEPKSGTAFVVRLDPAADLADRRIAR